MYIKKLPSSDPILLAKKISQYYKYFVFLHSSLQEDFSGRYSYLAYDLYDIIKSNDFTLFEQKNSLNKHNFLNRWFGYFAYELYSNLEHINIPEESYIDCDNLLFMQFNKILIFDHKEQVITLYSNEKSHNPKDLNFNIEKELKFKISNLNCNMEKNEYLNNVKKIKKHIKNGDIYQANLTRKFTGLINSNTDNYLDLFLNLIKISPSAYSCYMKINELEIISSSPEQFIKISKEGNIEARPIKGSAPRFENDIKRDIESKRELEHSIKDRAENLMIVDLMRNDLARSSVPGTVQVDELFKIYTYNTIYHLVSKISAQKKANILNLEVIKNAFPPGSMTGTPKINAIKICNKYEKIKRGIYSGAIGYFTESGEVDLSVVIRTLIIKNNKFEFQVGGAILYDSDPEKEWQETITKSKAIMKLLSIDDN